jgi:hypothetical protein
VPQLNAAQPIIYQNGTMQAPFREQMNRLNSNLPILGTGSPEGVVAAPLYTLYINKSGTSGTIEYRKMLTDISGNKLLGWVAV